MTKAKFGTDHIENEHRITLGLLNAVHENERVSQRSIASELSIALGLTNTYLKRCIKKGLIKVNQAPANRYAYYLTPKGFSEKTRLTAAYLSQSLNLFRVSRNEAEQIYSTCLEKNWRRVVLLGDGDLVEIFAMSANDKDLTLALFANSDTHNVSLAGLKRLGTQAELEDYDCVIVCDMNDPIQLRDTALGLFARERVLAPAFLGLDKQSAVMPGDAP
ncbi:winged helix-turn-helix transcriptional regulator [Thalassospiraceae bacterium LMO-JJ14]|nr:winged helix-turn-helix transcriptional regulator [Thalassospiraceae bacterium LMO-JJ14]